MGDAPRPADERQLDQLRRRLKDTRFVQALDGEGWERGTDPAYLGDLVRNWADGYDWRAAESRLLARPWVRTSNGMRAIHQRATDPGARAVVLLHGWPDSFLRFTRVLPLLRDLHVVVPCLPGYPYSDLPGRSREAMAEPITGMLAELGYDRYVVSGGDIGSGVAESLAREHPERVSALHLTDIPLNHLSALDRGQATPAELAYSDAITAWRATEGGYIAEQSTKPNTLAVALGDSPAGLAAWLVEKLRGWSDCGGEVERAFPRHDLLTWITLYWVTGAIGTSFGPYADRRPPRPGRVQAPTVISLFPRDLLPAPRHFAERIFDVRIREKHAAGGHFGAWEQPAEFARDLRAAVGLADSGS